MFSESTIVLGVVMFLGFIGTSLYLRGNFSAKLSEHGKDIEKLDKEISDRQVVVDNRFEDRQNRIDSGLADGQNTFSNIRDSLALTNTQVAAIGSGLTAALTELKDLKLDHKELRATVISNGKDHDHRITKLENKDES